MIPSPWTGLILALGTYRLLRLLAFDTFPPVARGRAWILGEEVVTVGNSNARMRLTDDRMEVSYRYRRALLAELVHCAFCLGLWLSAGAYVLWLEWPRPTLYGAMPFAISAFIGLVARNLDP
jgi:hypothetical protein